jgi:hypothetical protein
MALSEIAAIAAFIAAAVLISRIAFGAAGGGAAGYNALAGIVGKTIWAIMGLFLIIGGVSGDGISALAVFGVFLLTLALFLGRGHAAVLREEDIRAKIGGD